jgi:hypothetical protein
VQYNGTEAQPAYAFEDVVKAGLATEGEIESWQQRVEGTA